MKDKLKTRELILRELKAIRQDLHPTKAKRRRESLHMAFEKRRQEEKRNNLNELERLRGEMAARAALRQPLPEHYADRIRRLTLMVERSMAPPL